MTSKNLAVLLPKPARGPDGGDDGSDQLPSQPQKRQRRQGIQVACRSCQRRKIRCDGERPDCEKCRSNGEECKYELPETALSRSAAWKESSTALQQENLELRELYRHLRSRSEADAYEIFRRLRSTDNPIALLNAIRQADILLTNQSSSRADVDFGASEKLDFDALGKSPIKVPARPWTNVAGDGIVSELISAWFKWDNPFIYPYLDRECFLDDMRGTDPGRARYCSPFLVNALCAVRSFTSDTVKAMRRIAERDMRVEFLAEAKKQFDLERGRPSLTAVQGLWTLFTVAIMNGTDQVGKMYRLASYDMLRRMRLKKAFAELSGDNPADIRAKRALSKTAWAVFCNESIMSVIFRHTHIVPPPNIPCLFPDHDPDTGNLDILGQPFTAASLQPPLVSGIVNLFCQLAVLLSEIMTYNVDERTTPGNATDMHMRIALYRRLEAFGNSLPHGLRHDTNFTPQTSFLRVFMNVVAYAILRPLRPDLTFGDDGPSVKLLIFEHCALDTQIMEQYFNTWTGQECSPMVFIGPLNTASTMIPFLSDPQAQDLFTRQCRLMRMIAVDMPLARYVMQGFQALSWSLKQEIPALALPYFQGLGEEKESLRNIPASLMLVQPHDVQNFLKDDDDEDSNKIEAELGILLAKWSALSVI